MGSNMKVPKQRFKILKFVNPRSGTTSWRVSGIKRNGERIRENFAEAQEAQYRYTELEGDYQATHGNAALRATRLTEEQIALAEAGFKRLDCDGDLLTAIDHWLRTGKPSVVKESPRLDDALKEFLAWVDSTPELRPRSKSNLHNRVGNFVKGVGNKRVIDVVPEHIEQYLAHRDVTPETKDGDRRAISSFFSWCLKGKRHWCLNNPSYAVEVEGATRDHDREPVVLPVGDCERLMRAAEGFAGGKLVPYLALCLFGGLRPYEAARLKWEQINLADGEIRLKGPQTKTGKGRVVAISDTLKAWLTRYRDQEVIYCRTFDRGLQELRVRIGYGPPTKEHPHLQPWVPDVLRHTAISHYFRLTGSYGRSAEQFGNSEGIIKDHYQGRVSSADTKRFYAILPKGMQKIEVPRVANVVALPAVAAA